MVAVTKTSTYRKPLILRWTSAGMGHNVYTIDASKVLVRTRTGDALPRHAQIIADGGNATTALSASESWFYNAAGTCQFVFKDGSRGIDESQAIGAGLSISNRVPDSVRDAAIAKAVASYHTRLRKMQTPFEGLTFLGELRETVQLIKHPFKQIRELSDAFATNMAKLKNSERQAKAIADLWLQYRFAVLPLMSDIADLVDLVNDVNERESTNNFRVYGKSESSSVLVQVRSGQAGLNFNYEQRIKLTAECIIRAGFKQAYLDKLADGKNPFRDAVDDLSSLVVTGWELIPFSFLIDYFYNVGSLIEAATTSTAGIGWTSRSVILTTETTEFSRNPYIDRPDLFRYISAFSPRVVTTKFRSVNRTAAVPTFPPVRFSLPGSAVRLANIAALFVSLSTSQRR